MPPFRKPLLPLISISLLLLGLAGGAWLVFHKNLHMVCQSKQWPGLDECTPIAASTWQDELEELRGTLTRNPGDALSYAGLARFSKLADAELGMSGQKLEDVAARMAPNHETVLLLKTSRELDQGRWEDALQGLLRLARMHGNAEARKTLVQLLESSAGSPELLDALVETAMADTTWLEPTVRDLVSSRRPIASVMPLIGRVARSPSFTPSLGQLIVKHLKAEGKWQDAYAVWLQLWNKPLGWVFNGGFDSYFISDGFDWELGNASSRSAGVRAELAPRPTRGLVLRLTFTGKPLNQSAVRQDLMLPPGKYRFAADFDATSLRTEHGMVWMLTCLSGGGELMRTLPMVGHSKGWRTLEADFVVPSSCGWGTRLALETQAGFESKTGLEGELLLDNVALFLLASPS